MNRNTRLAAFACSILLAVSYVQAQYVGKADIPEMTVKQALQCRRDDTWAILTGKIIRHIRKDDFIFADATGEIKVEIDDKVFAGQRVDADTKVRLTGEIDAETFKANEFDVKRLEVLR